ncbi:hypothetical protein GCM10027059_14370 [Myceligenerans halotolerans]
MERDLPAPGTLLLLLVAYAVGGLLEEIGWTGFLLPRLITRFGEHAAALLIGVLWKVLGLTALVVLIAWTVAERTRGRGAVRRDSRPAHHAWREPDPGP